MRSDSSSSIRQGLRLAVLVAALLVPQSAAALPAGFHADTIASGFTQPMNVAWAPDGRMFVAEKPGTLKVVPTPGAPAQTVLDFRDDVNSAGDRGFLGLAIDSNFALNGYVYLSYTAEAHPLPAEKDTLLETYARVARLKLDLASRVVERVAILGTQSPASGKCPIQNDYDCMPSDSSTHSIGTVISAPDGTLFVGLGDGSGFGGPDPKALRTYNTASLSGKILHVDRNGRGLPGHPFCRGPGNTDGDLDTNCTKVYAAGFRNPYRFTRRPNGDLIVGDVGWDSWEEIDRISVPGKTYGWPCYEGAHRTPGYQDFAACATEYAKEGTAAAHVTPVYEWPHNSHGSGAAFAGPTYSGSEYPTAYRGRTFVADYTSGWIRTLDIASNNAVTAHAFHERWVGIHLGAAPNGDLIWINPGNFAAGAGFIVQVSYAGFAPNAAASATPLFGAAPLEVDFDGSASTDPDGDALTYKWDFGDGATATTSSPTVSHTYTGVGSYHAKLTVDDGHGHTDSSQEMVIEVGNAPPEPEIVAPQMYRDGQLVEVTGSADDSEDGPIPGSKLSWLVRLIHNDHVHPLTSGTGSTISFTPLTDHDADSHYKVTLSATDSRGSVGSKTVDIDPELSRLTLETSPPGAELTYGGRTLVAPSSFDAAIGFLTAISAPATLTYNGADYAFQSWSDGGARSHGITVPPDDLKLVASYSAIGAPITPTGPGTPTPQDEPTGQNGPKLTFVAGSGFGARNGVIAGLATHDSLVARVDIALARTAGARCRWAIGRRLSRPLSCSRPRWARARVKQLSAGRYRWRTVFGSTLTPGSYRLLLKGRDVSKNVTRRALRCRLPGGPAAARPRCRSAG